MKSTLPFFAFVSLNIMPYMNQTINDYNTSEYLPDSKETQGEKIVADNEELLIETVKYN